MKILVTGSAGFIGFHLTKQLLARGDEVVGIDNINDYYDVNLKYARLADTGISKAEIVYGKPVDSTTFGQHVFIQLDLCDQAGMQLLFENYHFDAVCNLAAQAGVRYSLTNPAAYLESNLKGFLHVLECCRYNKIKHLVYASSSSVYGLNQRMPFSVSDNVDHPVSLYAASKKSNELMAHAYSHLFNLPSTALRFFTVYGPWGRPDMAPFLFTKAILEGKSIDIFNNGQMKRDFTYIDDIVSGIVRTLDHPATSNLTWDGLDPDPGSSTAPYRVFNIGKGSPLSLMDFIYELEKNIGITAVKNYLPMQDGDVAETWAEVNEMSVPWTGEAPVSIATGVKCFVGWYLDFYTKRIDETAIISKSAS